MPADETSDRSFEFKAETQRILQLVINSLYTHTEVFLRELISNASDALDKARFVTLTDRESATSSEGDAGIDIVLDRDKGSLTIEDNGVGMTREEVIENLGTIARSGTDEFIQRFTQATKEQDRDRGLELIGQFGVGFYSAFMVASRVDVETRSMKAGSEPVLWRSAGDDRFTVLPGERETPGTRIVLHLKDDAKEFAERWRVEEVIKKYSDFVMFPIRLDGEVVNRSSALWRLPRAQVSAEQYAEFFKHLTQGRVGSEPLSTIHYSVDAPVQFSALLFVPEKAPADLFMVHGDRPGLRLYAKRVLIMESCESLLPVYLRFLRGVVDSEDLQLNVSREMLQENRTVRTIEQQLTKQVLKELERIAEEEADVYLKIWRQYGQVLKEGLSIDFKNKDALTKLCRFQTLSRPAEELVSLDDYVAAKRDDQKAIWYLTGVGRQQLEKSPHLEIFRQKNLEVLLLVDPIDEWVAQAVGEYQGLPLKSVAHGEIDVADELSREIQERMQDVAAAIKKALGDKVDDVRASTRLTETASCLVSREGDPGANLERLMRMLDDRAVEKKRILELNPAHPFVQNLVKLVERDPASPRLQLWSEMLYDQALLSEGVVEDPVRLVQRLQELLVESSNAALGGEGS
jgi:molecular chaperone HtpG